MPKSALEEIQAVYEEERAWFARSTKPWARPISRNGETGFAILYTPPFEHPPILFCGQHPSNFGDDWADEHNAYMLSGTIPSINTYREYEYPIAEYLKKMFDEQYPGLLDQCVGMNIWHCQARTTPSLDDDAIRFFRRQTIRVIRALAPKTIVAIGKQAFQGIENSGSPKYDHHNDKGKWYPYYGHGKFGNTPVWFLAHVAGNRNVPPQRIWEGAVRIRAEIAKTLGL